MILRPFLFTILILQLKLSFGQDLSTYFLDSLRVTVDNEVLISSGQTKVFFFKNTNDTDLVLYDKKPFKLVVSFKYSYATSYLDHTGALELYRNNKVEWLSMFTEATDSCDCDILCGIVGLSNAVNPDSVPAKRTDIKISYRYTYLAPKDIANYHFTGRQGLWVGRHTFENPAHNGTVSVNYKNDLKEGKASMMWDDGGAFETSFEKGKKIGEGQLQVDLPKVAKYRRRPIPAIVLSECAKDKVE